MNTKVVQMNLTATASEFKLPNTYVGNFTWYTYGSEYFTDNLTESVF